MFEDQILNEFMDHAAEKAKVNIKTKGRLETEDAIPLILKSQFNHIAHLEQEMVTKTEFHKSVGHLESRMEKFENQLESLKDRFNLMQWTMGIGFTFLSFLMTYLALFK